MSNDDPSKSLNIWGFGGILAPELIFEVAKSLNLNRISSLFIEAANAVRLLL